MLGIMVGAYSASVGASLLHPLLLGHNITGGHDVLHQVCFASAVQPLIAANPPHRFLHRSPPTLDGLILILPHKAQSFWHQVVMAKSMGLMHSSIPFLCAKKKLHVLKMALGTKHRTYLQCLLVHAKNVFPARTKDSKVVAPAAAAAAARGILPGQCSGPGQVLRNLG